MTSFQRLGRKRALKYQLSPRDVIWELRQVKKEFLEVLAFQKVKNLNVSLTGFSIGRL